MDLKKIAGGNARKLIQVLVLELLGCLLISIGIYNFAVLSEFPMTGFSGIAIILYRLWELPVGLTIIALNIPVALICYRLLGKRFFMHSIWCMLLSSVFIDYVAPLFPAYGGSRMLAAISCGVIAGIGYALVYMQNASTGGSDFIIMAVKANKPYLSLGKIAFWSDVAIILAGGFIFQDVDGIIYGMIINYLFAFVVDKLMYGVNAGKVLLIVTLYSDNVIEVIENTCGRGATAWAAKGGYKSDPRQVVMCACDNKQTYKVQKAVKAADPSSFIIVMESNEVHGEGFSPVIVGEKSD